jgi:hypothetical protein
MPKGMTPVHQGGAAGPDHFRGGRALVARLLNPASNLRGNSTWRGRRPCPPELKGPVDRRGNMRVRSGAMGSVQGWLDEHLFRLLQRSSESCGAIRTERRPRLWFGRECQASLDEVRRVLQSTSVEQPVSAAASIELGSTAASNELGSRPLIGSLVVQLACPTQTIAAMIGGSKRPSLSIAPCRLVAILQSRMDFPMRHQTDTRRRASKRPPSPAALCRRRLFCKRAGYL